MWKIACSVVAVAVAQESPKVNATWQVIRGKDVDPGCPNRRLGLSLEECEALAELHGYKVFVRDYAGVCCFKDGDNVADMLSRVVTNHACDIYYTHTSPIGSWAAVMCHDGGSFEQAVTRSVVTTHSAHADVDFSDEVHAGVEFEPVEGVGLSAGLKETLSTSFGVSISQETGTSITQTVNCPNPGCLYQFTISGDGGRWDSPYTACTTAQPPPCPPLTHLNGTECVETTSLAPGNSSYEIKKIEDVSIGKAVMV